MTRSIAVALVVVGWTRPSIAHQAPSDAVPSAPAAVVLQPKGVDEVVLDTVFAFAQEFNARPADQRRNARIVGVAGSFLPAVAPLVYKVHVPADAERARRRLREGVGSFLEGYVRLLVDRGVFDIELRQSETIQEYLGRPGALSRCNEIPCPQPPCCEKCRAPSGDPPGCPP